ncbi:MAG: OmpA family protein [Bryobacteraceae bacterium]|nr:OmpA family protein [Bryobacteraceae bacterium]MDW8379514.1 OmpA family protein [Bryobacterales bacterium]
MWWFLSAPPGWSQGLATSASKEDWEEINFVFDSSTLVDGYPSLLRLAELLKLNPSYRVKLVGHTDSWGSEQYNERLALARASTVKAFLEKYGARPDQILVSGAGEREPKVDNRTADGRFMNRRVVITVLDEKGRVVSAGGIGDAIRSLERAQSAASATTPLAPTPAATRAPDPRTQQSIEELQRRLNDCCADILKRLDTLADIVNGLRQLRQESGALRDHVDNLQKKQDQLRELLQSQPKPLSLQETQTAAEKGASRAIQQQGNPHFSLLGVNLGADDQGRLTFSGRGRYFLPFKDNFALQAQGEYLYFRDRKEGQFDLGLANRIKAFQAGLFASFKNVQLREFQSGGTLGQAALTLDYIFRRGRLGAFGTKGFLDHAVLRRISITRTLHEETYLKIVDQAGLSAAIALWKRSYLEGNVGYLKSRGYADRPGGTLRLVYPLNDHWALTLEGGMNETLLGRDNNGRVVGGIAWGNFLNPREFHKVAHAVPVDVPRVRYEVLTRRVRTGNEAPIADAGPDQIGIQAGLTTLDGSASYDPEGDPITFAWTQISGPAVSLAGANTSRATFTSAEGQSYVFRLTVTDDKGASSVARVLVTTARIPQVRVVRFAASPQQIRAGQSSSLIWTVENADEVSIDSIGRVDARSGSVSVSPQQTTTYRLTARNRSSEVNETVTVVVEQPSVRVLFFTASPLTLAAGQSATLSWQTENADTVEISGLGAVAQSGTVSVSPSQTTSYTLTARNRFGQATAQLAIQVRPVELPSILRFTAVPGEIGAGESATLIWQVDQASEVSISGLGRVNAAGSSTVTPAQTTNYVLTARNAAGEVSATATVVVIPPVRIVSFTATPASSPRPGEAVRLSWVTENATEATIDGLGSVPTSGSVEVNPTVDTSYTLRAFGRRGQTSATVRVTVAPAVGVPSGGPIADAGPDQVTTSREIRLDGSRSRHPEGLLIGFSWRAVGRQPEAILGADTPTPTVRFAPLAFGEYVFELTVTDSRGRFSRATTKVFFGAY